MGKSVLDVNLQVGLDNQNFEAQAKKMMSQIAGSLARDFSSAMTKGMGSADISKMGDAIQKSMSKYGSMMQEVAKIQKHINELQSKAQDDATRAEIELNRIRVSNIVRSMETQSKATQNRFQDELANDTRLASRRMEFAKQYNAFLKKTLTERADAFRDTLSGTIEKMRSADLVGLNKGVFTGLRNMGSGIQQRGIEKRAENGELKAGVVEKLGAAVAGISGAALAIGAVAGGLLILVKGLIDADNQAKEMNRELINSSGALDIVSGSTGDMTDALRTNRDAIFAQTSALQAGAKQVMELGLTSKEYQSVLQRFAETGTTWAKMSSEAEEAGKGYLNYVTKATTVSRMFGLQLDAATDNMSNSMQELGLSIDSVAESFAVVGKYAQESGYGAKRFYNMVQQATSGMTMYNVRLEDTAALMTRLSRVLGMKGGAEFMNKMGSGFESMDTQGRVKTALTTGMKTMRKLSGTEADIQSESLAESLKGLKGVEKYQKMSPSELREAFTKMSQSEANDVFWQMQQQGAGGTAAANRANLMRQSSRAASSTGDKNLDLSMMSTAMGGWGTTTQMAGKLAGARGVSGKLSLLDDEDYQAKEVQIKAAISNVQGLSPAEQEKAAQVMGAVHAGSRAAKAAGKAKENETLAERDERLKKQQEIAKQTGMIADDSGKLYRVKQTDKGTYEKGAEIGDDSMKALLTFAQSQDKNEEARKNLLSRQEELSKAVADNTYDLNNLVKESVLDVLNTIAGYVSDILVALHIKDGLGSSGGSARDSALRMQETKLQRSQQTTRGASDRLHRLQGDFTTASDDEKLRLAPLIQEAKENLEKAQDKEASETAEKKRLQGTTSWKTEAQKKLFEQLGETPEAFQKVSAMSESEAAKQYAQETRNAASNQSLGGSFLEGIAIGATGGLYKGKSDIAAEAADKAAKIAEKEEKGETKAQKESTQRTKGILDILTQTFQLSKEQAEASKNSLLLQSLQAQGVKLDPEVAAAIMGAKSEGDRQQILKDAQLVQDAYIPSGSANYLSYNGPGGGANLRLSAGDAVAIVNEKAGRGGGAASVQINMTFNGPADAPTVRNATVDALKQFYGQISGTAATQSR